MVVRESPSICDCCALTKWHLKQKISNLTDAVTWGILRREQGAPEGGLGRAGPLFFFRFWGAQLGPGGSGGETFFLGLAGIFSFPAFILSI